MTSEIKQAFAHPEQRSRDTAPREFLDRISVRNHIVDVEIGAFQVERGITQRISFDIVVEVRESSGAATDDVDDILSYDRITEAITTELAHERLNLLETLAERIAGRILIEPQAVRVFVRIEKLDRGVSKLGVEIVRSRSEIEDNALAQEAAAVAVLHIPSFDAMKLHLEKILDLGCSIVLTAPNLGSPWDLADTNAKLRIDLLAIEQNAWRMAALNQKIVVVDTWTELDWGIKNGQTSIWAPSKMVLDSADETIASQSNALELSKWLATELNAKHHIVLNSEQDLSSLRS